jgi:hypothetical protein
LPLHGRKHNCHGVDYFIDVGPTPTPTPTPKPTPKPVWIHFIGYNSRTGYLTGKISKNDKFRQNYLLYGTKIRNACQIQKFLARKKIWNC